MVFILLLDIKFFEDTVHTFGIKFKICWDSLDPCLIHAIKPVFNYVPNFKINEGVVFIEVYFDYIRYEKERELYFLCFWIFLETWSDISCFVDVIVKAHICDFPFHFLQCRSKEEGL